MNFNVLPLFKYCFRFRFYQFIISKTLKYNIDFFIIFSNTKVEIKSIYCSIFEQRKQL